MSKSNPTGKAAAAATLPAGGRLTTNGTTSIEPLKSTAVEVAYPTPPALPAIPLLANHHFPGRSKRENKAEPLNATPRVYKSTFDEPPAELVIARENARLLRGSFAGIIQALIVNLDGARIFMSHTSDPAMAAEFEREGIDLAEAREFIADSQVLLDAYKPEIKPEEVTEKV